LHDYKAAGSMAITCSFVLGKLAYSRETVKVWSLGRSAYTQNLKSSFTFRTISFVAYTRILLHYILFNCWVFCN